MDNKRTIDARDTVRTLLVAAAVMAAVAAGGGLFHPGVYRDNAFTTPGWWGTDIATLFIALPAALVVAWRCTLRSEFITLGLLAYLFYNAAFYAFGARLNDLFLLYVATMSVSLLGLILAIHRARFEGCHATFPQRFCGGFLILVGVGLAAVEIGQSAGFVLTGNLPNVVTNTAHPTHVVAALDLVLVVPFLVLAGVLLLKRNAWGFVIGIAISIKGALYMAGLSLSTIFVASAGFLDVGAQLPVWIAIGVGSAVAAVTLLSNVVPSTVGSALNAPQPIDRAA